MRRIWLPILVLPFLVGCDLSFLSDLLRSNGIDPVGVVDVLSDDATGRDQAPSESGFVTVEIVNATSRDAECRVTMRIAGVEVHLAERRVPAKDTTIVIGPDRCDTIAVEATFPGDAPVTLTPQLFRLGADFDRGSIVRYVLQLPAEPEQPADDDNQTENQGPPPTNPPADTPPTQTPPPPPPGATIAVDGLASSIRVNPGDPIAFSIVTTNAPAGSTVFAFADIDGTAGNGNEIEIVSGVAPAARSEHAWDTSSTSPGLYSIYAELRATNGAKVVASHAGSIRVNDAPSLLLSAPRDSQLVTRGASITVSWVGADNDDDAKITIFVDNDADPANGFTILRDNISEDNVSDRTLALDTTDLSGDEIFVGGVIDDGLSRATVYAGRLCLSDRLVGRLLASALVNGEVTEISGKAPDPNSAFDPNDPDSPHAMKPRDIALGAAIDIGGDLNGDGLADLVVSDPFAQRTWDGSLYRNGAVYVHTVPKGVWPRELNTRHMKLRIDGANHGDQFGAALTSMYFFDSSLIDQDGIAVGAPLFDHETSNTGAAYSIGVGGILNDPNGATNVAHIPDHILGLVKGDSDFREAAGSAVANIEINNDGMRDLAIGGPAYRDNTGRVAIFYGNYGKYFSGDTNDAAFPWAGWLLNGKEDGDRAGSSIASTNQLGGEAPQGVVIGAPGALEGAGKVYVIFGPSKGSSGVDLMEEVASSIFIGEHPGDQAGFAVSSVDFDGNGIYEILIGAPGYNFGHGRVYWIKNILAAPLIISLADVGVTIPGATFDGAVMGDFLGSSLGGAHVRPDSVATADDFLFGAPGAELGRGKAYLLEARQDLGGRYNMADAGTCSLRGWEFVGETPGQRVGASVHRGGDLNGDHLPDVAIGAPGSFLEGGPNGRAYLIFSSKHTLGEEPTDPVTPPVRPFTP